MILSDLESGFHLAVPPPGDRLGRKTRAVFGPDGQRLYIVTEAVFAANGRGRPGFFSGPFGRCVDQRRVQVGTDPARLGRRHGTEPADDTPDQFVDQSSTTPRTSTLIASQSASASASTASALAGTSVPRRGPSLAHRRCRPWWWPHQSIDFRAARDGASGPGDDRPGCGRLVRGVRHSDGNMGCVQNIAQYESGGVVCFMRQQDFPALGCENLAFTTVYLELYGSPQRRGTAD